jgi:RNA polymerase sigma-70 factor, ECF subfamily
MVACPAGGGSTEVIWLTSDEVDGLRPAAGSDPPQTGFAECYAASFHGLAVQLYVYTGDLDVAHELVQEAFCRALARWPKLVAYDDPVAWVRRVAFNLG